MIRRDFILLVEDDRDHAELILRTFRKHRLGSEITVLQDGQQALDFLFGKGSFVGRDTADLPQVIILDLKLPKLNGHQVLRRLRAEKATKLLPVVMFTTSTEQEDILKSYEAGANSYVQKPVNFQEFNDAVREMGLYWLLRNHAP